jgi:hypothetical protein
MGIHTPSIRVRMPCTVTGSLAAADGGGVDIIASLTTCKTER